MFYQLFEIENDISKKPVPKTSLTTDRYKKDWFDKKILQYKEFKNHLLNIVKKHKEVNFPWTAEELSNLPYEDLAEIAVACVNKKLTVTVVHREDYNDKSDTKCVISQHRNNIKYIKKTGKSSWMNSYQITGVKGKNGALRTIAYNTITSKFEYYYIPAGTFNKVRSVEIVLERYIIDFGQTPKFTGHHVSSCKWNQYRCDSFEEMALASH